MSGIVPDEWLDAPSGGNQAPVVPLRHDEAGIPEDWLDPVEPRSEPVSLGAATADTLNQFGQGFNQYLDKMAFGIPRLVDEGREALGIDAGRETLDFLARDNMISRFLQRDDPALTGIGRGAKNAGRMVGETVPAAALTLGMAPALAAGTQAATSTAGQITNAMASGIARNPGLAATGEFTAATGAGYGEQIARDAGAGQAGQQMGALAGSMVPALAAAASPATLTGMATRRIRGLLSPEEMARRAEEQAGRGIRSAVEAADPAEIAEARAIAEAIPGVRMTVAERTNQPALRKLQADLAERAPADMAAAERQRMDENERLIRQALGGGRDVGAELDASSDVINNQVIQRMRMGDERRALEREAADIATQLEGDRTAIGQQLRESVEAERTASRQRVRDFRDARGLDDQNPVIQFGPGRDAIVRAYQSVGNIRVNGNRGVPTPTPVMQRVMEMEDMQSAPGIQDLRSQLLSEQAALSGSNTAEAAAQLSGVRAAIDELDEFIEAAGNNISNPQFAQNYREFREFYRTHYADRFKRGVGAKILKRKPDRGFATDEEKVFSTIFQANTPARYAEFRRIFEDPNVPQAVFDQAATAFRNGFFDAAYRAALDPRGQLSPNKLQSFINRHREVVQQFDQTPGRSALELVDLMRSLERRQAALAQRQRDYDASDMTRWYRELGGSASTKDLADQMISDRRLRRSYINMTSAPGYQPRSQLARQPQDTLRSILTGRLSEAENPAAMLAKNAEAFRDVLTREEFENVRRITNALARLKQMPRPAGAATEGFTAVDGVEQTLNMGLNQLSSRIFAVQSGRTSPRYVAMEILGRVSRGYSQRQTDEILQRALLDPELGARLSQVLLQPRSPKPMQRLYTYLASIPILPDTDSDQE